MTFKAAFDTYPGALAISGGAGRPSFVNDTMRLLLGAHGIRGAWPLEDIWEALRDRAVEMRIQGGGEECMPVEAQGRLWALTRARDGTGGYELSGQDITEVKTLTREFFFLVGQSFVEELYKYPLHPAVVIRITSLM